jgi:hypothetical protein
MKLFNVNTSPKEPIKVRAKGNPTGEEVLFRFLPGGQVIWYSTEGNELLTKGYLDNHVVFTVMDWIGKKVASATPVLYRVKDRKSLRKYEEQIKNLKWKTNSEGSVTSNMNSTFLEIKSTRRGRGR